MVLLHQELHRWHDGIEQVRISADFPAFLGNLAQIRHGDAGQDRAEVWTEDLVGQEVVSKVRPDRVTVCDTEVVGLEAAFHQDLPVRANLYGLLGGDPVVGKAQPPEVPTASRRCQASRLRRRSRRSR